VIAGIAYSAECLDCGLEEQDIFFLSKATDWLCSPSSLLFSGY